MKKLVFVFVRISVSQLWNIRGAVSLADLFPACPQSVF